MILKLIHRLTNLILKTFFFYNKHSPWFILFTVVINNLQFYLQIRIINNNNKSNANIVAEKGYYV